MIKPGKPREKAGSKQTSTFPTRAPSRVQTNQTLCSQIKKNKIHSAMIVAYFFWEQGVSLVNSCYVLS